MKQSKEPRRKSDEKRKRKNYDNDFNDDPFFRGKAKKRQANRFLDDYDEDSDGYDDRH